jgi:hypothetical protein
MNKKPFLHKYAILTIAFFILFAWLCLFLITSWKGKRTIQNYKKNTFITQKQNNFV